MRDTVKSKEYFEEYICEETNRITKFEKKIASGTLSPERVIPVKSKLCSIRINLLIAKYSNGLEIEDLRKEFLSIIDTIDGVWNTESYDDNLRLMSLCVLFNVDDKVKAKVSAMIKENGEYDCIIECLSSSTVPSDSLLRYPDVYEELWSMLRESDTLKIKKYLQDKWYKSHHYSYWFDAHKANEKLYFGYWAFEVAALMKIFKIDATGLKEVKYFPYDLYCY